MQGSATVLEDADAEAADPGLAEARVQMGRKYNGGHGQPPAADPPPNSATARGRNGRWMVFSSKRNDGLFVRPYFTYMDSEGRFHKPLVMPQKDPRYYDTCINTYNLPSFVTAPVRLTSRQLAAAVASDQVMKATLDLRVKPAIIPKLPVKGN